MPFSERVYKVRFGSKAEIIAAIAFLLTEAQSQGTKVTSTVARGGKTEGISISY